MIGCQFYSNFGTHFSVFHPFCCKISDIFVFHTFEKYLKMLIYQLLWISHYSKNFVESSNIFIIYRIYYCYQCLSKLNRRCLVDAKNDWRKYLNHRALPSVIVIHHNFWYPTSIPVIMCHILAYPLSLPSPPMPSLYNIIYEGAHMSLYLMFWQPRNMQLFSFWRTLDTFFLTFSVRGGLKKI